MSRAQLTGPGTWFEDFTPGQTMRHMRGKTMGEVEVSILAQLVMNSAQGHFNDHEMSASKFGRKIAFGGITASVVMGLASQDTVENARAELGIRSLRLKVPVVQGDTLYAVSEVVSVAPSEDPGAGVVVFRHYGLNQREELVCVIERSALIARRPGDAS